MKTFSVLSFTVSFLLATSALAATKVGVVGAINESVTIVGEDGSSRKAALGGEIFLNDTVKTDGQGSMQLMFLDRSALTVSPNSAVKVDQFVYNPATGDGKLGMESAKGAFRFIGGALSKKQPVTVKTPVSTIGIRGAIGDFHVNGDTGATDSVFLYGEEMSMTGQDGTTQTINNFGQGLAVNGQGQPPQQMDQTQVENRIENTPVTTAAENATGGGTVTDDDVGSRLDVGNDGQNHSNGGGNGDNQGGNGTQEGNRDGGDSQNGDQQSSNEEGGQNNGGDNQSGDGQGDRQAGREGGSNGGPNGDGPNNGPNGGFNQNAGNDNGGGNNGNNGNAAANNFAANNDLGGGGNSGNAAGPNNGANQENQRQNNFNTFNDPNKDVNGRVAVDLNGDGRADGFGIDRDGDGRLDNNNVILAGNNGRPGGGTVVVNNDRPPVVINNNPPPNNGGGNPPPNNGGGNNGGGNNGGGNPPPNNGGGNPPPNNGGGNPPPNNGGGNPPPNNGGGNPPPTGTPFTFIPNRMVHVVEKDGTFKEGKGFAEAKIDNSFNQTYKGTAVMHPAAGGPSTGTYRVENLERYGSNANASLYNQTIKDHNNPSDITTYNGDYLVSEYGGMDFYQLTDAADPNHLLKIYVMTSALGHDQLTGSYTTVTDALSNFYSAMAQSAAFATSSNGVLNYGFVSDAFKPTNFLDYNAVHPAFAPGSLYTNGVLVNWNNRNYVSGNIDWLDSNPNLKLAFGKITLDSSDVHILDGRVETNSGGSITDGTTYQYVANLGSRMGGSIMAIETFAKATEDNTTPIDAFILSGMLPDSPAPLTYDILTMVNPIQAPAQTVAMSNAQTMTGFTAGFVKTVETSSNTFDINAYWNMDYDAGDSGFRVDRERAAGALTGNISGVVKLKDVENSSAINNISTGFGHNNAAGLSRNNGLVSDRLYGMQQGMYSSVGSNGSYSANTVEGALVSADVNSDVTLTCTTCNFVHWGVWASKAHYNDGTNDYVDYVKLMPYVAGQAYDVTSSASIGGQTGTVAYSGDTIGQILTNTSLTNATGTFTANIDMDNRQLIGFNGSLGGALGSNNGLQFQMNGTTSAINDVSDVFNAPITNASYNGAAISGPITGGINGGFFGPNAENIGGNFAAGGYVPGGAGVVVGTGVYLGARP